MNEKFENIDHLFKKELENFAPETPDDLWENIAVRIPEATGRKKIHLFYKIAAGFALLISTGIIGHNIISSKKGKAFTVTAANTQNEALMPNDSNSSASIQESTLAQLKNKEEHKDGNQALPKTDAISNTETTHPNNIDSQKKETLSITAANTQNEALMPKDSNSSASLQESTLAQLEHKEEHKGGTQAFPQTDVFSSAISNTGTIHPNNINSQKKESTLTPQPNNNTESLTPDDRYTSSEKPILALYKDEKGHNNGNTPSKASINPSHTKNNQNIKANQTLSIDEHNDLKGDPSYNKIKHGDTSTELDRLTPIIAFVPSSVRNEELEIKKTEPAISEDASWDETEYELVAYDDSPEESRPSWLVGGQAGPQYAYRNISSEYKEQELLDNYNSTEDGVYAYSGGVNIEYSPARRLSIQSGIYYSKIGQQKDGEIRTSNQSGYYAVKLGRAYSENKTVTYDIPNSTGDIVFNDINTEPSSSNKLAQAVYSVKNGSPSETVQDKEAITLSQYFEYIEVPVIARYKVIDRKFDVHLLGGVSTNILVGNTVYLDSDSKSNEDVGYTGGVKPLNYSATAGFGLGYEMSEKISLTIEPQLKYYLNKQISNSEINVHPYSIGVMTGIKYSF